MYKQMTALTAALTLILSTGCQSQETNGSSSEESEKTVQETEPKKETKESNERETAEQEKPAENETAKEENAETDGAETEDAESAESSQSGEAEAEQEQKEKPARYVSPFELRDEIQISLTREEAEEVLQNKKPEQVKTADGTTAYRYDYMPENGYKPAVSDPDIEGIIAGKMEAQVFIWYTPENTVERYTIYHKTEDGKAVEYRDEGNGEGMESILN
ncbi:hypothetical protein [Metabacillus sp. 84]|uniref:hypothetical protein n=1 Tax=Metabacillus sp. 84 TaxID=3404705 RepID=UPI003CEBBD3F